MDTIVDSALVGELAGRISGSALAPDDAGYETARAVHNGLVDRPPALIVRSRTASDGVGETAVPRRDEGWNLVIPSGWTDPADTEANIAWSRETFAAMCPYFGTGRWLDYLGDDQADGAIRAAYGPNYERLVEVERRYDPDNVFHLDHNVVPRPPAQTNERSSR